jgi:hypothetical protein
MFEPEDEPITLDERIASDRGFDLIARNCIEAEAELLSHLVLPLLDKAARRDDEAALEVAPDQQFLDEQPGHDGLAGARIVGEQEAQRLSRQHLAINRRDLVRQCLDLRCGNGEIRVKKVGEPYSAGLGCEPEQTAVGIERVAPTRLAELEAGFLATIGVAICSSCRTAMPGVTFVTRLRQEADLPCPAECC